MNGESTLQHDALNVYIQQRMLEAVQGAMTLNHFQVMPVTWLQRCITWLFPKTVMRIEAQATARARLHEQEGKTLRINRVQRLRLPSE